MKRKYFLAFIFISFVIEIIIAICLLNNISTIENDPIKINELTKEIELNYPNNDKYPTFYNYIILDDNLDLIYSYKSNNKTLTDGIKNGDIIIDLNIDGKIYKLIIDNNINKLVNNYKNLFITLIIIITLTQLLSFAIYFIYLNKTIIKPFNDMKEFALRVASGNLDIPLKMDKGNNFGAFTESFDIMRSELKKAKLAEMEAEKSKRELVARLSHDIKTPVASIKSISEVGLVTSKDKDYERFNQINQKADQINTLVSNLFTITIEELDELSVNPVKVPSYVVSELIKNSDYLNKINDYQIPNVNLFIDRLRLQQVFDNILANSYKYANTNLDFNSKIDNSYLIISIKDYGNSIKDIDMPLLLEKYKRGSNVSDKDGAGLGLYISKSFIEAMNGKIEIKNDNPGFNVLLYLRII